MSVTTNDGDDGLSFIRRAGVGSLAYGGDSGGVGYLFSVSLPALSTSPDTWGLGVWGG